MNFLPKLHSIITSTTLLLILFLSSCSNNDDSQANRAQLLGLIDNDALIVGACDPAAFLVSAGAKVDGNEVVLPDNFKLMAQNGNEVFAALSELTSAKGVDYHNLVFSLSADDNTVIFALNNPSSFASWAKDKDMTRENVGELTVFVKNDVAIVVDGNIAWLIVEPESAADAAKKVNDKAAKSLSNPVPQWIAERLSTGDATFVYDLKGLSDAVAKDFKKLGLDYDSVYTPQCKYFSFECNFNGPSLKINGQSYSAEGKQVDLLTEGTYEPISTKALSLVKDSQIALAFSLPESWKKWFENVYKLDQSNAEYADLVLSTYDALKSISLGVSLREGASIATFKPTDIIATVAVVYNKQSAELAAEKWIDFAKKNGIGSTMANGWKVWKENSTSTFAPFQEMPDFKLHFTGRDDLALLSTDAAISSAEIKPDASLDKLIAFFSVDLKKGHPVLQLVACPFGIKIYGTSNVSDYECEITLTDTDKPFIESIINFAGRL